LRPQTTDDLQCAVCGAHPLQSRSFEADSSGDVRTGVVWCGSCRSWFPVEDGILELLPAGLAYPGERRKFWASHETTLTGLGLSAETPAGDSAHAGEVRRQQEHFDWYADNEEQTYDAYEATPFWRAADRIALSRWRRLVRPGGKLLDIACAQGRSTLPWMDLDLDILAFDISKRLVRRARERARQAGGRARAEFCVADGSRLPFVSARFDTVVTYGVLHHLPDPAEACREIARVLKPGGNYFASENNRTAFRGAFDTLMRIWPLWHEEAGAEPLISEEDLRRWLEPQGFRVEARSSVFLPPHLVNLLGRGAGAAFLGLTDRIGRAIPWLRRQGGLILVTAVKGERA
jgi:ubiquinone/menaquinone biosynthesis C-methylase UbiE/uncharacterized protein YbaR (Trm112 family)